MRLTLDLPPEASSLVDEAVRSGDFADPTAVVVAAIEALRGGHGDVLGYSMDELRRLGDEGEASGPGKEFDIDAIKREARLRSARGA